MEQVISCKKKHLLLRIIYNNTYVVNEQADLTWLDEKELPHEFSLSQCLSSECRIAHKSVDPKAIHDVPLLKEDGRSSLLFDRFFFCVL